jgi:predicted DNA-binding protein
MELTKKTTILLPPDLHERLSTLAAQKHVSMGELIRKACEQQYRLAPKEERIAAVQALAKLSLPVASPKKMKKESIPSPKELLR